MTTAAPTPVRSSATLHGAAAQVFDDPSGLRRRWLVWTAWLGCVAIAALAMAASQGLVAATWPGSWSPSASAAADPGRTAAEQPAADRRSTWVLPFEHDERVTRAWLDALRLRHRHVVFLVPGSEVVKSPALVARALAEGHGLIVAPYSGRSPDWLKPRLAELEVAASQIALAGTLGVEARWARCAGGNAELASRGLACLPIRVAGASAEGAQLLFEPGRMSGVSDVEAAFALETALGRSAADDEPPSRFGVQAAASTHRWLGAALVAVLNVADAALRAMVWLTLAMFAMFFMRFCWVSHRMLARARSRRAQARAEDVTEQSLPPVTVIVPAYNEQSVIVATVHSLLACRYPHPVQVMVVDDGSSDGTFAEAQHALQGHPQVRLLSKPNGGKCSALNLGIAEASTEIVVCIDADTQLDPMALQLLCRHFSDPRVGAVAGNPKVGNRRNLLTRLQALEYVTLDSVERQAMEGCNAITCITGALGAYRKPLVQQVGGYTNDTLAEDTDMTLQILRSGARVVYEDDAVAWTEAPETLRDFMKQRFRWMYGTVQAAFKHRAALGSASLGSFGLVAVPNLLLLQVGMGCLLLPLVDLTALLAASWLLFGRWVGWLLPHVGDALTMLEELDWMFYTLLGVTTASAFMMAAVALRLDRRERLSALLWLLPMQLVFRVLLGFTAYRCIARMLTGRGLAWGRLVRTGHVELPVVRAASALPVQVHAEAGP